MWMGYNQEQSKYRLSKISKSVKSITSGRYIDKIWRLLIVLRLVCLNFEQACFFVFSIRFTEWDELAEFNKSQSSMTEGYWKPFCVPHSQLAL